MSFSLPQAQPADSGGQDSAAERASGYVAVSVSEEERTLLDELAQSDPAEATRIERELDAIWDKTGSAAADLLLMRGREAMEEGEIDAAIEHWTALTDHAPDFAEGWHLRATAYFHADLFGPAVMDLERALALNPNNYKAMIGLGAIFETFNDPENAYKAYQRAQSIHPHHEAITTALERLAPLVAGQRT